MNLVVGFISGFLFGGVFVPLSFLGPSALSSRIKINNRLLEAAVLLFVFISIIAIGAALTSIALDLYASSPEQRKELGRYSSFGMYVGLLTIGLVAVIAYRVKKRKIERTNPKRKSRDYSS